MNKSLKFHPKLILRTPVYPFKSQFDEEFIRQCLFDPQFLEALYLASPGLHDECLKWRNDLLNGSKKATKLLTSLIKYYCRTFSRCTPFGLFAGCSIVNWGNNSSVKIREEHYSRHTRLDMQFLAGLVQNLAATSRMREKLLYFPNTSIYRVGDEIRYVEYLYVDGSRVYQISSVIASDYLLSILSACQEGALIREIVQRLTKSETETTEEESRSFINQLIDFQLLISKLEPSVTGKEFFYQILDILEKITGEAPDEELTRIVQILKTVDTQLKRLDETIGNDVELYDHIATQLRSLESPIVKDKLFQVDLSLSHTQASLNESLQDDLIIALEVLHHLTPKKKNEELEYFKAQFLERYGDKEMPLLEVLDDECGIGYFNRHGSIITSLIDDLELPEQKLGEQIKGVDETRWFIYNKLIEAQKNGNYTVDIKYEEIKQSSSLQDQFPPSMSVLFRVIDKDTILLEGAGGSSAVNLLGRFAHTNQEIEAIIKQITAFEQNTNPLVEFAEVNHLPQGRVGNILSRPVLRKFEIPYLTQSSLPHEDQIPLKDLFVSVQNDRVILWSRQLNKEIIPRLSAAHNYTYQCLPVYHFLCDLQTQELQTNLTFKWEVLFSDIKFLPRVTFKSITLHPATWNLTNKDLQILFSGNADSLPERFQTFQKTWKLPRYFVLVEGDNELLVDTDNFLIVETWVKTIRNYSSVKLREFLFNPKESVVTDHFGRPYVNQFIALLIRETPSYLPVTKSAHYLPLGEKHKFWLGSEWLYFKWYCGVKSSDRILNEVIRPLTDVLIAEGLVDQWFFIRYADPSTHLRVRFHLPDISRIGEVVLCITQYLQPYLMKEYIWKSQTETYERELERYGHQSVEMSETLFFHDSMAALGIVEQTTGDEQEPLRWLWGVRSVDELLNAFAFTLPNKLRLIGQMKEAFGREFGINKDFKLQLDAKYRSYRTMLDQFLDPINDIAHQHPHVFKYINSRNAYASKMEQSIRRLEKEEKLGISINSLVSDHIHMLLNRLMPVNQRLHEMVIYDFLFRQYQKQAASHKMIGQ